MSTQNLRDTIADKIVAILSQMRQPRISLVTREPFEPDRIAITDFPAVLVQMDVEERETMTMGATAQGRRAGTITYVMRGYVRGVSLDQRRSELITGIEAALDQDRYLELRDSGVTDSQLIRVEVINRQTPLAEVRIEFQVRYNYLRGQA